MGKQERLTAEELRDIREKLGLTQTQFAEDLGFSLRGYQYMEEGQRKIGITVSILARLILKTRKFIG